MLSVPRAATMSFILLSPLTPLSVVTVITEDPIALLTPVSVVKPNADSNVAFSICPFATVNIPVKVLYSALTP